MRNGVALRPGTGAGGGVSSVETVVALAAVFLVGLRYDLKAGITTGVVVAAVLFAVWGPALRRLRGALGFLLAGLVTVLAGIQLSRLSAETHAVNSTLVLRSTGVLLLLVLGTGVVAWARTVASLPAVGLAYGAGVLAQAELTGGGANPWKTQYAVPAALLLLSLAGLRRRGSRTAQAAVAVAALLLLAGISAVSDSRSYAASFVLAALLVVWQSRPRGTGTRSSRLLTSVLLLGLIAATYWLGTKLLVAGYLGANAQARTIKQIDQSGSVILGGRPELQATLALMRDRPMGYGVGIAPTQREVLVAKAGLNSINYNPNNGYVEKYMLGGHIELHSIFGDLWAGWGIAGLGLLLLVAWNVLRMLTTSPAAGRAADPMVAFLGVWTAWNLLFSPLYTSVTTLIPALALGFAVRPRRPATVADVGVGTTRAGTGASTGASTDVPADAVPASAGA